MAMKHLLATAAAVALGAGIMTTAPALAQSGTSSPSMSGGTSAEPLGAKHRTGTEPMRPTDPNLSTPGTGTTGGTMGTGMTRPPEPLGSQMRTGTEPMRPSERPTTGAASSTGGALSPQSAPMGEKMRTGTKPMHGDRSGMSSGMHSGSMGSGSMGSGSMGSSGGMRSGMHSGSGGMGGTTSGAAYSPGSTRSDDLSWAYDTWPQIEANWDQYRSGLGRQFSKLSSSDLASPMDRADVVALIQERYNLSNERAHERLEQWQRRVR